MKRLAFLLLAILSLTSVCTASHPARMTPEQNARESRKAARRQEKMLKKANKKQRKAEKKFEKAQRKATKKANRNLYRRRAG